MTSTIDKTLEHVLLLARHAGSCTLSAKVIVIMMELRVPTKCVGFEFLKRAILLQYKDPTRALSGDIYQEIALHYRQTSEDQVDQAIREAVEKAWRKGSREALDWYFSYDGRSQAKKPTNSEVISKIACVVELWQGCCNGEVCYEREC